MIKILIIGITGTLGHKMAQELSTNKRLIIHGIFTNKSKLMRIKKFIKLKNCHKIKKIGEIIRLINNQKFNYVINCAGLIKQKKVDIKNIYLLNTIFPIEISNLAETLKFRFIHFSTDCVFDGKKGDYLESQFPNAKDIYGISKAKGEPSVKNKQTLVLRTSFIGHEIIGKYSLLNWFINSNSKIYGFSNCYFNGLTNIEISKFLKKIIEKNLFFSGLFHFSGKKINKYQLLKKINLVYNLKKNITPSSQPKINRTLNNSKIKKKYKYKPKTWDKLLKDLFLDYRNNVKIYKN
tara:strand:- start:861 stop:1739 length:879 start_codon:yes stop_codon:yes gene_type:complete